MNTKSILNFLKWSCACFILSTCNTKTEITIASQDVNITVFGTDGKIQPNAKVILFDNKATFYTQNYTFGNTGAVGETVTNEQGIASFKDLNTEVNYYVLAYTIDKTTFGAQGYEIYNDNSLSGYEFLQKLNKSSTTNASISLRPAEALVSFYASQFNTQGVPIKIYIENDSIGTIDTAIAIANGSIPLNPASNPNQKNVISKKIRIGVEPAAVRFVNKFNCNNISRLSVTPGGFTAIDINLCNAGQVKFTAFDVFPIVVKLNGNENIGILNDSTAAQNQRVKFLASTLEPGDYTYDASAKGCSWQGKFTITSNTVTDISLSRCVSNQ